MSQPLLTPQIPAGEEARVAALYGTIEARLGFVPDGLRLYGISPPLLETFVGTVGYLNTESTLGPRLAAMIRYLVSSQAHCSFCIDMNEGFLTGMGLDLAAIRAARGDLEAAPVEARERPLLRLALKAVTKPEQVSAADLDAARAAGWDDRGIFDAVALATGNRAFNLLLATFKVEHQGVFAA
ncbi:MAG: hypothetical protein M0037_05880 [Betaproteobacteria bacterium]|nr:hypothetical protein [Betaproteobacteria bacterium]